MNLKETIRKVLREEATDTEYAVIEILKPSSRMPQKWYFQAVPYNKTQHEKIYIRRGPAGTLTISTKNIKVLKKFKESEKEEMDKYLEKVRDEDKKKGEQKEGLHDTSWENDGEKITLMDLLDATDDIPVENVSVEELKPHLLTWDGDEEEVKKIDKADLQYPILILVDDDGEFISIIDGHHRAQKASRKGLKTIKAKIIPINNLPKKIRKVFGHMGKQEFDEYARTLKNARRQGRGLRFSKVAIENNPQRFRPYSRERVNESDPKVGTGKKPKGSERRLYTDENPSDTVSVKFRTKEDIIDTLNKDSFKSKPHKRQSQIINLIHQRVRAAYQNSKDPETKNRLKRAFDYITQVKEKSKEKTIRLQKQEQTEGELTEKCWKGYTQKGMKTMFGKRYPNCVKKKK